MNTATAHAPLARPEGQSLLRWLGRYVSKRRLFLTGMGFAAAIAAAVLVCMGSSLADVYLNLAPWLRWTTLLLTAGTLVWLAVAGLRKAASVRRRMAMDEIEALLPARGQLMRTALEEAAGPRPADPVHAMLADGLLNQAGKIASGFQPEKSLPWPQLRRRWLMAGGVAAALVALVVMWGDFRTAVRRFLQPSAGITFTQVAFVDAPSEIVAGNECTIAVKLGGRRAAAPSLAVRRGDVPDEPVTMKRDSAQPGVYFLSIGKPGAAVTVQATAGDGSTQELTIPVVYPPKLKEIAAELKYPAYTGLKPASQKSPDIEAVEGTVVTVSITTDRPLSTGKAEFSDGTTAPLTFSGAVTSFTAPLNRGKLTWKLAAVDQRGLQPPGAGGKWIGKADQAPKIEWVTPKDDIEATPLAEVTLRAKAKDDFGLLQTGVIIQAGGKERTLMTQDFKETDGVPVSAVVDALAELEAENTNIRDNVKVFAFARDRYPAPAGKERRGVSDLKNIDIRQFKVWRAMMNGGGSAPPPPKAQKALMKLEEIIKQQRGIVNTVFRFKEENVKEQPACKETAGKETKLSEGTAELKTALKESETPPAADDLLLLDTAAQQMKDAATALEPMELEPAWTSADGALTSLLELRREFMKLMSKDGKPCDCEQKPDDFKLPSLTELAKEAERLAKEEEEVAKGVPLAKGSTAEGDKLSSRQASAQSDAGELFDKIVTHPEVTDLAQSRMGDAEKSMSSAAAELRERRAEESLPPLETAKDSLNHLAQHLRGLDAAQAANTLKQAAEMAQKSAEELKGEGKSKSEDGKKEGEGKKELADAGKEGGKEPKPGSGEKPGQSSGSGEGKGSGEGQGETAQSPPGDSKGDKPGESKGETAQNKPGEGKGDKPGENKGGETAQNKPGEGKGEQPGGSKPGEAPGSAEERAARDAATINDWLKNLAKSESLGRTGERIGALQKDAKTDDLAKQLGELAAKAGQVTAGGSDAEKKALAGELDKLGQALAAEHQRMVQGTLEKLAAAQAAAKAMREAGKPGNKQGNKPGEKPGSGAGKGDKPGEGKGEGKGEGSKPGEGQGNKPGEGKEGEGQGSALKPGDSSANAGSNGGKQGPVRPQTGQGWGFTEASPFSNAKPGSLKFTEDLADLLKDFQDTELTELSDELVREMLEKGYNRKVDSETLGQIEARLEALIQDVIQRQILAGKSDRVPPDMEARVENYFRRLSEDTGDEEEEEEPMEFDPPQIPQVNGEQLQQLYQEQHNIVPQLKRTPAPQPPADPFSSPSLRY